MCYFVEINLPRQELEKRFKVPMPEDPRYMPGVFFNAFNQPWLPVIGSDNPDVVSMKKWGLIPFWVKDEETADKIRKSTFNAKAETLWEKPSFKAAAKYRRCMILVHGFFEYHSVNNFKIPFYIKRKDNKAFAIAGVYESWTEPKREEMIDTCSIITVPANPMLEKIHNVKKRMPAILEQETEKEWLNINLPKEDAGKLLLPFDDGKLEAYSISKDIIHTSPASVDKEILKAVKYRETEGWFKS